MSDDGYGLKTEAIFEALSKLSGFFRAKMTRKVKIKVNREKRSAHLSQQCARNFPAQTTQLLTLLIQSEPKINSHSVFV